MPTQEDSGKNADIVYQIQELKRVTQVVNVIGKILTICQMMIHVISGYRRTSIISSNNFLGMCYEQFKSLLLVCLFRTIILV